MLLIFQFKNIFQRNENKAKQQKVIQLPDVFLKLVINQFLLYPYFPDL